MGNSGHYKIENLDSMDELKKDIDNLNFILE